MVNSIQLESQILSALGAVARIDCKYSNVAEIVTDATRPLLRQWIISKGMPERRVWDQIDIDDYTLAKCFANGDHYLNAVIENKKKKRPMPRGAQPVSIDLAGGFTSGEVIDLLGETPDALPSATSAGAEVDASIKTVKISETDLAKAANAVITPRLEQAKRDLRDDLKRNFADLDTTLKTTTRNWVEQEIEKRGLGDHLTDEIIKIATASAQRAAEEMLPKRLEIVVNGVVKPLSVEPRHEMFDEMLQWLLSGEHVYAVGPKGSGKTNLGAQLAKALDFFPDRFYPIDQSLTKYDVKGYKSPTGEYIATLVYRAVKFGGLMLIDEADMWAAAALGSLNSILANNFGTFGDEVVEVHHDFKLLLCANTYGHGADRQYQGRNPLDAASLDRFIPVEVDYDENMERQIFGSSPWLDYVWRVRKACLALKMPERVPSMRAIRKGLKGYALKLDPDRVCQRALWWGAASDVVAKIKSQAGEPPRPVDASVKPVIELIDDITDAALDLSPIQDEFRQHVINNAMVLAIRTLHEHYEQNGAYLSLKDAKDRAEQYRDGLLRLEEVFA